MSPKKEKSAKSPRKFILILELFKRNFLSLHRLIWGRRWKRFGSKGIHNPELYEKLIQEALK